MKIAAAYIRVSTDSQTELSPDSQIKLIREYAKSHDMIVPDDYIFRDDGISGRTAELQLFVIKSPFDRIKGACLYSLSLRIIALYSGLFV